MTELSMGSSPGPDEVPAPLGKSKLPGWVVLIVWLVGAIAVFSLLAMVLLFAWFCTQDVDTRPFERAKWLEPGWKSSGGSHTVRQEMVDDLLAQKLKVGMPMNEVQWLIGSPDTDPYFKPGEWTYFLGLERGMIAIDNEWLAIDFDELGRVSRVQLATD